MGFFSDTEIDTLRIARMSLHIVGGREEFQPKPELPVEHDEFLLNILKDIASDAVYRFADNSSTKSRLEAIASGTVSFEEGAQDLARDFGRLHPAAHARDGAFFVFELLPDGSSDIRIYALMKYDYRRVLELQQLEGSAVLREIMDALVSDKGAIQKAAIVRTVAGQAEAALCTRDRMGRPAPVLTDYFSSYLEVVRDRDDAELTRAAKEAVRTVLDDNRQHVTGRLADAVARANGVLRSVEVISQDVLSQAVWVGAGQPQEEDARLALNKSLERQLKRRKLAGLSFAPAATVLPRFVKRQITTTEGVKIEYDTALEGQSVVEQTRSDGSIVFTITTQKYREDVSADQTRRAAGRPH